MNVLLLTPKPKLISGPIINSGDGFLVSMGEPSVWPKDIDFIISYGYRHIVKEPYLSQYKGRIINIHISILPWNRGADPNFWSWFDNTPKGVTFHQMDAGIDTGPIIAQYEFNQFPPNNTLGTSYKGLELCVREAFHLEWPRIKYNRWRPIPPEGEGSYHKTADKKVWMDSLPLGWDTPVAAVEELGRIYRSQPKQ